MKPYLCMLWFNWIVTWGSGKNFPEKQTSVIQVTFLEIRDVHRSKVVWTYRFLDESTKSKVWRGSWYWGPLGRCTSQTMPNPCISYLSIQHFRRNNFFGVEKRNVWNHLKRVLTRFRNDLSHARGVTKKCHFNLSPEIKSTASQPHMKNGVAWVHSFLSLFLYSFVRWLSHFFQRSRRRSLGDGGRVLILQNSSCIRGMRVRTSVCTCVV